MCRPIITWWVVWSISWWLPVISRQFLGVYLRNPYFWGKTHMCMSRVLWCWVTNSDKFYTAGTAGTWPALDSVIAEPCRCCHHPAVYSQAVTTNETSTSWFMTKYSPISKNTPKLVCFQSKDCEIILIKKANISMLVCNQNKDSNVILIKKQIFKC